MPAKTGINTAEGKNLVGAFWPPRAVVCDLALLDSLCDTMLAGSLWVMHHLNTNMMPMSPEQMRVAP